MSKDMGGPPEKTYEVVRQERKFFVGEIVYSRPDSGERIVYSGTPSNGHTSFIYESPTSSRQLYFDNREPNGQFFISLTSGKRILIERTTWTAGENHLVARVSEERDVVFKNKANV